MQLFCLQLKASCLQWSSLTYPLTRNCYENNTLRIIFRNIRDILCSRNVQERKTVCKELRVRFLILPKIIVLEYFFVSNNFVSQSTVVFGSLFTYSLSFFTYNFSFFCLQLKLVCLQWEGASNKHPKRL